MLYKVTSLTVVVCGKVVSYVSVCLLSRKHADRLKAKCLSEPETMVVFVGDSGAGKSTLINALLDERDLLPTSNLAACTAVPIHVSASVDGHFSAHIEFMSETAWKEELKFLFDEATTDELTDDGQLPDCTNQVAAAARAKFEAVYGHVPSSSGDLTAVFDESHFHQWLGRTIHLESQTVDDACLLFCCGVFL